MSMHIMILIIRVTTMRFPESGLCMGQHLLGTLPKGFLRKFSSQLLRIRPYTLYPDHPLTIQRNNQCVHLDHRIVANPGVCGDRRRAAAAEGAQEGPFGPGRHPIRFVVDSGQQSQDLGISSTALHRQGSLPCGRQHPAFAKSSVGSIQKLMIA